MSPKEFGQIKDWAFGMPSRVPGTTSVEALKTYGAIQSMFGKDQALTMGDSIARFGQVLGNQKGNWDNTSEQVLKMSFSLRNIPRPSDGKMGAERLWGLALRYSRNGVVQGSSALGPAMALLAQTVASNAATSR